DFDILVPNNKAVEAVNLLRNLGWTSEYKIPKNIIPIMHSCGYTNSNGLHHLDLHWHLLIESCQSDDDDDFWVGALQTKINNIPVYVLNPADFFLHICIHGMKWSIIPPFRWVADAMFVLNLTKHEFDWNRLITQARKRHLTFPLLNGLEYLINNFNAPVPAEILTRIREIPISKTEKTEYKYKIENQKKMLLGNVPVLWFDSLRLSGSNNLIYKLLGFAKYAQLFWNLKHLWQLPFYTLFLSVRKIKRIIYQK
ncbi:MAG TPA: nucleotidyltransferase family protein, partial [Ignavibacteriaceae bacterium]|nr:nucleotidyltransferase family protein [Ignavibacteriaceae bacterium]